MFSGFNTKAKLWVVGRKNIFLRLEKEVQAPVVWFHCASLGEFEMARPLIESFRKQFPKKKILLSFFSPSGYEIRKNYDQVDYVYYLPIDSPSHARKWVNYLKPELAVFAKYEFWHYYLQELHKQNVPTFLISALFRKNQRFFSWYGQFFRKDLKCYNSIFVQDEISQELLFQIGISSIISGDTRIDRVKQFADQTQDLPLVKTFKGSDALLVLGSSWLAEEELLKQQLNNLPEKLKIIIAPHDISASHLDQITQLFDSQVIRYSQFESNPTKSRILLIDNIGLLAGIYAYADYAFVGGGFSGKLHNVLEPAAFGAVLFFGPNHQRFPEATALINGGAACAVESDFAKLIWKFEQSEELKNFASNSAKAFINRNSGATAMIYQRIIDVVRWN